MERYSRLQTPNSSYSCINRFSTYAKLALAGILLIVFTDRVEASGAVSTVFTFSDTQGGAHSKLIQGSDGSFYGTILQGGSNQNPLGTGYGLIFRVTSAGAYAVIHSFVGTDGIFPTALVSGSDGNLYGATARGGANDAGTIFKISLSGTFTLLYSFQPDAFGSEADPSRLAQGNDGNFYGMTANDGANSCGSIFRITPDGVFTTLYSFPANSAPAGGNDGLLLANDGSFYGISSEQPQLFKITTAGVFTTVHQFVNNEGSGTNTLVQGTDGNFYGTSTNGGDQNAGTAFQVTPAGIVTILHSFAPAASPSALTDGGDGSYYGTMAGALFRVSQSGTFTVTYYFDGSAGLGGPGGSMTRGSDGYLYGYAGNSIFRYDNTYPVPPNISIGVRPNVITAGKSTMLFWNATSADSCTASGDWSGAQVTSGSESVSPTMPGASSFTLSCTGPGGVATLSATINVNPAPSLTMSFMPSTVNIGKMATLNWTANNAGACTASGAWNGAQLSQGNQQVSQNSPGNYIYSLSCPGFAGDSVVTASATLVVTGTKSSTGATGGKGGGGALDFLDIAAVCLMLALGQIQRTSVSTARGRVLKLIQIIRPLLHHHFPPG
jgi:uncharacterized repeat protein (TIGR03803 family)